ncbi:hypothetical protein GAY22_03200 [Neisseria gonorrhoeae]|nr:hypothetical protein GAY22_03200 [Neisseria gonorrhoeae]
MKITHCKLKKEVQKEPLRSFVPEVTALNGIGNFWNQAKRALRKYNGIDRKPFPPLLRECEFRFNFGTPSRQLKILRDRCGI